MADNLKIVITADNRPSTAAFAETNAQLNSMDQLAARITTSISQHFQAMARQIQQAMQMITQSMGGMQSQAGRLIDQFARPAGSGASAMNGGALAGVMSGGSVNRPSYSPAPPPPSHGVKLDRVLLSPEPPPETKRLSDMPGYTDYDQTLYTSTTHDKTAATFKRIERQDPGVPGQGPSVVSGSSSTETTLIRSATEQTGKLASANGALAESNNAAGGSFASSMMKGFAYYEIITKVAGAVKALTIDSAKAAASEQIYATAMYASAAANGIQSKEVENLHQKMTQSGLTGEAASKAIMFAMTGDLDLKGMPRLAGMAKGLTAMNPELSTGDALQSLIEAISTGQVRSLRRMGVYGLDFNTAERKYALDHNRSVSELLPSEQARIREAEVLRVAPKYEAMGANLDPLQQVMKDLTKNTLEAKDAIGKGLLPAMVAMAGLANMFAEFVAKHPWAAQMIALGGTTGAGALAGAAVGAVFGGVGALPGAAAGALAGTLGLSGPTVDQTEGVHWGKKGPNGSNLMNQGLIFVQGSIDKKAAEDKQIKDQIDLKNREDTLAAIRQGRRSASDLMAEAESKGLEGKSAIEAQYAATDKKLHTRVDAQGNVIQFPDKQIHTVVENAKKKDIEQTQLKMVRDLNVEIAQEGANQLEGADKINAATQIRLDKLKAEGWLDDAQLVNLTGQLAATQKITAQFEEQKQAKQDLVQAGMEDLQGYKRLDAELQQWITHTKELGSWSQKAEDDRRAASGTRKGTLDDQFALEFAGLQSDTKKAGVGTDIERLQDQEQAKLASLETVYQWDLKSKISIERQKYQIELQYIQLITDKKKELRNIEFDDDARKAQDQFDSGVTTDKQHDLVVRELANKRDADLARLTEVGNLQQTQALKSTNAAIRQSTQEEYTQLYGKLKSVAGGLFDSLTDKTHTFLQNLGDMFKRLFMDIAKQIFESQFAKMMTQMLTGTKTNLGTGNSPLKGAAGTIGDILGRLGLGSNPQFQAGKGSPGGSAKPNISIPVPPVTTESGGSQEPDFNPGGPYSPDDYSGYSRPPQVANSTPANGGYSAVSPNTVSDGNGSSKSMGGALAPKDLLKGLKLQGGVGGPHGDMINGLMTMAGLSMALGGIGQKGAAGTLNRVGGTSMAVYGMAGKTLSKQLGAAGGVLGSVGAGLGMDGIVRGGWGGIGEATLGGAMLGTAIMPGIGTAIGAAVGFLAAGLRTLIGGKPADQKLRDRIRSITGVDVKQTSVLLDWVKMVGGNTDMMRDLWIRSRAGQDAIQMYAQETGQKFTSKFNAPQFAIIGAGGSLFEASPYMNGTAMAAQSTLPNLGGFSMDQISSGVSSAPANITVHLDGAATTAFHTTNTLKVLAANPRAVQGAALSAQASGYGRTQQQINTTSPMESRS